MNEYEEKSRWTEYGRALAAAVINGTELPTAEWNKNCDLNKKSDRIIIDWYRLSAVAFAAELNPEQNDGHLYYRDGKRVRQNVEKKLGQENKLLWENKPASYWAFRSMKAYPCYDKADIFSGIEGMLDWKPEAKKPELWELYDSCDYEAETDLPF